jgi:hypothetical protein
VLESALEHLVKGIVDNPDDVTVDLVSNRRGRTLEVRVNPEDLGKVIGRNGPHRQGAAHGHDRRSAARGAASTSSTPTRSAKSAPTPPGPTTSSWSGGSVARRASRARSPSRSARRPRGAVRRGAVLLTRPAERGPLTVEVSRTNPGGWS